MLFAKYCVYATHGNRKQESRPRQFWDAQNIFKLIWQLFGSYPFLPAPLPVPLPLLHNTIQRLLPKIFICYNGKTKDNNSEITCERDNKRHREREREREHNKGAKK